MVRVIKSSKSFTATADGDAIVISTTPVLKDNTTVRTARSNMIFGDFSFGVDECYCGPVIVDTYDESNLLTLANRRSTDTLEPGEDNLKGMTRCIGWGVEVVDVTAELYKQGTCTVCQYPACQRSDDVGFKLAQTFSVEHGRQKSDVLKKGSPQVVAYLDTPIMVRPINSHPTSVANAMLYEGSRQWEAKAGAYTVIPFSTEENPPRYPEYTVPMFYMDGATPEKYGLNDNNVFLGQPDLPGGGGACYVWGPTKYAPVHCKCIIMSGLNAKSTFQVNAIWYLETFPDTSETSLISLARPSACFDPVALKMISCAMQELPVAVPVADNSAGDWFLDVMESVLPTVGTAIGGFLGGPAGAAAGGALGRGGSALITAARIPKQVAPPNSRGPPKRTSVRPVPSKKAKQQQVINRIKQDAKMLSK